MKKISLLLLLLFAFLLAGCSKPKQTTNQNQTQDPDASSNDNSELETEDHYNEFEGPDHVVYFYNEYKRVLEENDFSIKIDNEITKEKSESSTAPYYYQIIFTQNNTKVADLNFSVNKDNITYLSGFLWLWENATNDIIKNMITATLLVTDPSLSYSEAEAIMLDMANSYNTGNEEPVHESDSYFTYLGISLFKDIPSVQFQHKDEMNVPVDTSLYSSFEYDAWMAPLNQGELACLTGEYISGSDYSKYNTIIGEDGQQYLVTYPPQWFFNILESNKRYTFYGDIRPSEHDLPVLDLSYCVPLD